MKPNTIMTRTIQRTNRSGTFSSKADYTPLDNGNVEISEWVFDSYGILPSGTEIRIATSAEAEAEYRERKANGWNEIPKVIYTSDITYGL